MSKTPIEILTTPLDRSINKHGFVRSSAMLQAINEVIPVLMEREEILKRILTGTINDLADMHDDAPECAFQGGDGCRACDMQGSLGELLESL